jgi:cell division protein FtsW
MGVLPTKGLTLPLMSYGGSSIVMSCVAVALLLRISHEHPVSKQPSARRATVSTKKPARKTARKTTQRKSTRRAATKQGRWA